MNIRPRPKQNYPNLWKLFWISILPFFLLTCLKNLWKSVNRGSQAFFSKYSFVTPSREWQRVAQGDLTNLHTLIVQMHLLFQLHSRSAMILYFYVYSTRKTTLPLFVILHIIHLYKLTKNETKYLVPLLLTSNNQKKSNYVPKSIGHFSPLMLPLDVCQLNTS